VVDTIDIWNQALDCISSTAFVEDLEERRPEADACRRHYDTALLQVLEAHAWRWARRQATLVEIGEQQQETDGDDARVQFEFPYAFIDSQQVTVELVDGSTETELEAGTDYVLTPAVDGGQPYVTLTVAPATGQTVRITVATERVGWDHVYALPADCVTPVALLYNSVRLQMLPTECQVDFDTAINDASTGSLLFCDLLSGTDFDKLEYVAKITNVPAFSGAFVDAVAWKLAIKLALVLPKDPKRAEYCRQMYERALLGAKAHDGNSSRHREPVTPSMLARGQ
jgi:hypothetical protein